MYLGDDPSDIPFFARCDALGMEKYRSDDAVKAFLWEKTITRIPKS